MNKTIVLASPDKLARNSTTVLNSPDKLARNKKGEGWTVQRLAGLVLLLAIVIIVFTLIAYNGQKAAQIANGVSDKIFGFG